MTTEIVLSISHTHTHTHMRARTQTHTVGLSYSSILMMNSALVIEKQSALPSPGCDAAEVSWVWRIRCHSLYTIKIRPLSRDCSLFPCFITSNYWFKENFHQIQHIITNHGFSDYQMAINLDVFANGFTHFSNAPCWRMFFVLITFNTHSCLYK